MKLRGAENYDIGLDIGTSSVGWVAVDPAGDLLRFKGKPTWGSRLFDKAQEAADARVHRGQRRRLERRRWRLDLLQGIFDEPMKACDPEFFIRLRQSRLLREDRREGHADYRWPLFNDSDFTERDYYEKFPTIYHLRAWLMATDEQADLRLVYLALHNIVKHRGHFIWEGQEIDSRDSNMATAIEAFLGTLEDFCDEREIGYRCDADAASLAAILEKNGTAQRSDKKDEAAKQWNFGIGEDASAGKNMAKALAGAIVGLQCDMKHIFPELEAEKTKFKLSDDDAADAFADACPDDGHALYESMRGVYSAYVLQGLLSLAPGKTLSENKVREYERYGDDLKTLKELVRAYAPSEYDAFFRGERYPGTHLYDAAKAQGYTKYDLGPKKAAYKSGDTAQYDDFKKAVVKLFEGTGASADPRYVRMMERFENQTFLRRLKTSDNGSIPYQLHLEELVRIIENQGRFYPFLLEEREKLESLVRFRIPYYVGPLTREGAALDHKGKERFAWSERKDGMEDAAVRPWSWQDVIDRTKSAENFITRMTGECTYVKGADVLPRCSLLYEEYCVLNELNGAKWTQDGDKEHSFDAEDRRAIVDELFKNKRTVRYRDVADLMERRGHMNVHVSGGQGATGFVSKLNSYRFFCKDVLGVDELSPEDADMAEGIILWNTLFEDRAILREKVAAAYGERLTQVQIDAVCKKRFAGWGNLSRELLDGIAVETDQGRKTVMDVLREGDPSNGHRGRAMVLMQVLRDDRLGFQKTIDEMNAARLVDAGLDIADLPGSPAIRRSINQALRIVEEIVDIAGHPPNNIFVEVTREEDARNKGKRTKKRYDKLKAALEVFKSEYAAVWKEFGEYKSADFEDDRLMLYFSQRGQCLYSGKPIDINRLHSDDYEVDHIIPRSYVKDDSLANRVLVVRTKNQRKTDELLIDPAIRHRMAGTWAALHEAGLIDDKKYRNLMRSHIDDAAMKGFIARQLVETSQSVKIVQTMLAARYPDVKVVPVKAGLSSQLRDRTGIVKCREANNYHHAHDAYLACRMGQFIQYRHPAVYDNPVGMAAVVRAFVRNEAKAYNKGKMPGSSSFIVSSFLTSGFDKETGEVFKDAWDAEVEVERIRRQVGYRDCFISRMPVEDTGAFWDQTVYSPRGNKDMGLPLKRGLDPQKYGSYSREQFAYFFVYEANPKKKGRRSLEFAPVPVRVASALNVDDGDEALERYARKLAEADELEFVRIARRKVYKGQLIEIDGDRLCIRGKGEARCARELAFSVGQMDLLKRLAKDGESSDEERAILFDYVSGRISMLHPMLAKSLKLEERRERFLELDEKEQASIVLGVVAIANGDNNVVDISALGGPKHSWCSRPNFSGELSDSKTDFVFIDQSVTGMFERRSRLEL